LAADGSLELDHPMTDVSWAVRHALQYGAEAEVLGPPEAREAIVKALVSLARTNRPAQSLPEV
jgi:predicted DNA-binding transcriptional regulator YafY